MEATTSPGATALSPATQDIAELPARSPSPIPNPILTPIPTHPVDASDSSLSRTGRESWAPRASTPLGPYPMSPSKRAPTPLEEGEEQEEAMRGDVQEAGGDQTGLGLGLDIDQPQGDTTQGGDQASSPPRTTTSLPAWRSIPGLEALDESWAPANSVGPAPPIEAQLGSTSALAAASGSTTASLFDAKQSMARSKSRSHQPAAIASDSEAPSNSERAGSTSKGAATDTELEMRSKGASILEPGPSRPENRLSSLAIRRRGARQAGTEESDPSPSPRSISPASTESGLKEGGSQARNSVQSNEAASFLKASSSSLPKFGTAQSGGTDVFAETAQEIPTAAAGEGGSNDEDGPEATFIALSNASDLPPVLQPAWKRGAAGGKAAAAGGKGARGREAWEAKSGGDMFSPLKLQTMFRTPTPEPRPQDEEEQRDKVEATPRPAQASRVSPPQRERFTFRVSPSPSPPVPGAAPSQPRPSTPPPPPSSRTTAIPASASRPPPTPSGPHMPLRLFSFAGPLGSGTPRGASARSGPGLKGQRGFKDARGQMRPRPITQAPALGEANRSLEEGGERGQDKDRERKRLRVDEMRGALQPAAAPGGGQAPFIRRDYVREAPDFMERIRNVRLASDERSTLGRGLSAATQDGAAREEDWVTEEEGGAAPPGPTALSRLQALQLREGARNPTPATAVNGPPASPIKADVAAALPRSPLRISQRKLPSSSSSSGGSRSSSSSEPEAALLGATAPYVEGNRLISPLRKSRTAHSVLGGNVAESPRRFLRRWTAAAEVEYEVALEEERAQQELLRQSVMVARRKRDEELERRLEEEMREVQERIERRKREKENAMRRDREGGRTEIGSPTQTTHPRATDPVPSINVDRRDSAESAASSANGQVDAMLSKLNLPLDSFQRLRSSSSGLVNIAPTDMALDEMEKLGGGRMTFDRETMKWISRREARRRGTLDKAPSRAGTGSTQMDAILEASRESVPVRRAATGMTLGDADPAAVLLADAADAAPLNAARTAAATTADANNLSAGSGDESSDPFKDIESFAHSSGARFSPAIKASQPLSSSSAPVVSATRSAVPSPPAPAPKPPTLASKLTSALPRSGSTLRNEIDLFSSEGDASQSRINTPSPSLQLHGASAPPINAPTPSIVRAHVVGAEPATPPPSSRSLAPASARSLAQPPRSILKGSTSTVGGSTPRPRAHGSSSLRPEPRSISFADVREAEMMRGAPGSVRDSHSPGKGKDKTERIALLLQQLADVALGDDDDEEGQEYAAPEAEREEVEGRPAWMSTPTRFGGTDFPPASRSPWTYSVLHAKRKAAAQRSARPLATSSSAAHSVLDPTEASFLTNASFAVAHDRILSLITDVAPWEPGWEELKDIDLSGRRVESVLRLKEFLPSLRELRLDNNEIAYLTGLPASLQALSASRNRIPATVSFHHLTNLETLDVSHNELETLTPLSCLVHLRHLRADTNGLTSIEGIERLSNLVSLSLRHNELRSLDASQVRWPTLEILNLSHNELTDVYDIWRLVKLRSLVLEHNELDGLDLGAKKMSHLRVLRLSGNSSLASLDVRPVARSLRTLYADFCALPDVVGLEACRKLENLSLRQQVGSRQPLAWPLSRLGANVKRLFLSGNAFAAAAASLAGSDAAAPSSPRLPSLVYLELSACQLTSLPPSILSQAPNLRHLNLDHNLFSELPPLQPLARLKRLTLVGCRVNRTRMLLESVQGLQSLAVLDVRMNPCSLGLYPPIVLGPAPPAYPTTLSGARGDGAPRTISEAMLAPLPNPSIVQPDAALRAASKAHRRQRQVERMAEKSFFHRRQPGPDINRTLSDFGEEEEEGEEDRTIRPSDLLPSHPGSDAAAPTTSSTLFALSDARFRLTLPADFARKRELHRASLAMACPALSWLDGLLVDEEEVRRLALG